MAHLSRVTKALAPSSQLVLRKQTSLARQLALCSSVNKAETLGQVPRRRFSTLSLSTLPKNVLECEYAVRGEVIKRAQELEGELEKGGLEFEKIVPCNIGNPQAVGQKPVQFHRQVIACLAEPSLATHKDLFPDDVRERASRYLAGMGGSGAGAYSHSQGHSVFRKDVADYFTERDGYEADIDDIFLTDGASPACKVALQMAVRGPKDGVLLPIPQYPLYTASMSLLGGQSVGYFLDEEGGWSIQLEELERAVKEFRATGGSVRAIVVINPGNPTGQVLSRETIENVLKFAEREQLAVLADEVYQDNIHADGKEFISFRKVARDIGTTVEVFSFHSVSKGNVGECGLRGGLLHCENVTAEVKDQMYKLFSVNLCSNVLGQALMASVLKHPPKDGPSRAFYDDQRNSTRAAMKRKAKLVTERLNSIEGMECQPIEGAMYAFPRVTIKGYVMKKAISFATPADQIYCLEMVNRTGVVTVPGSGFGQRPGHFHFRMTILPDEDTLIGCLDRIEEFHNQHANGWFK